MRVVHFSIGNFWPNITLHKAENCNQAKFRKASYYQLTYLTLCFNVVNSNNDSGNERKGKKSCFAFPWHHKSHVVSFAHALGINVSDLI